MVGKVPETVRTFKVMVAAFQHITMLVSAPVPEVVTVVMPSSTISRVLICAIYFFTAKVFCPVLFQLVFAERDLAEPLKILPLPCDRRVFSASKLPPLLPVGLPPEITIAPPDS